MTQDYHGHLTREDGSHVPLTKAGAQSLWDEVMRQKAERAKVYPTETECLRVMSDIRARLSDMGWKNAIYCPKDGTVFDAIEFGCTTIFDCWYDGDWPNGRWWMSDGSDIWPTRPVAYRDKPAQAMEAGTAETTGSVNDSAVGNADAPNGGVHD